MHHGWKIVPGQVILVITKNTEVIGSNSLERNTKHGEEQAADCVSFCARITKTVIKSQINIP